MKGPLFIALACFLWAVDTLIRYPLLGAGVPATSIVLAENLILAVLFLPVFWKSRHIFLGLRIPELMAFLVVGVLGQALGTLAFTRAFSLVNPSAVILLQKLQPVVAVAGARLILKEPVKKAYLFWALVTFAGGLLISWEHFSGGVGQTFSDMLAGKESAAVGVALALLAVVGWGASTVLGKWLSTRGPQEKEIMAGRFGLGLMAMLAFAPARALMVLSAPSWGKIALMVALSGLLGLWLYYKGLKLVPARVGTLMEMSFPFFAVLLNWGILGVALSPLQLLGGALLLLGATVVQWKHY